MTEWRVPRVTWAGAGIGLLVFGLMAYNIVDWAIKGVGDPRRAFDSVVVIALYVLGFGLLVVRPRVRVAAGEVEVRNPLGTTRFPCADVVGAQLTPIGLRFALADGRQPLAIVFADVFAFGNAEWRACVQAVAPGVAA